MNTPSLWAASWLLRVAALFTCAIATAQAPVPTAPEAEAPAATTAAAQELAGSFASVSNLGSQVITFEVLGTNSVEQLGELIPKGRGFEPTLELLSCRVRDRLHGDQDSGTEFLLLLHPKSPRTKMLRESQNGVVFMGSLSGGGSRVYRASPETKDAIDELATGRPFLYTGSRLAAFRGGRLVEIDGAPAQDSPELEAVVHAERAGFAALLPRFEATYSGNIRTSWKATLPATGPLVLTGEAVSTIGKSEVTLPNLSRTELLALAESLPPPPLNTSFTSGSAPGEASASIRIYTDRGQRSIRIHRSASPEDATLDTRTFAAIASRLHLLSPCLRGLEVLTRLQPLSPPRVSVGEGGTETEDLKSAARLATELFEDPTSLRSIAAFEVVERIPLRQRNQGVTKDGVELPRTLNLLRCRVLQRAFGDLDAGDEFLVLLDGTQGLEVDPEHAQDARPHLASLAPDRLIAISASKATRRQLERVSEGLALLEVRGRAHRIEVHAPWTDDHGTGAFVRDEEARIPYPLLIETLRSQSKSRLPRIKLGLVTTGPGGWRATVAAGLNADPIPGELESPASTRVTIRNLVPMSPSEIETYDLSAAHLSRLRHLIAALPAPPASFVSSQSSTPCAGWLDIRIARPDGVLHYRLKYVIDDPATRPAFRKLAEVLDATGLFDHGMPSGATLAKLLDS